MAISQWKLAWLTPNLGILWILVSSFWLCESKVANPIIYRLVPRPPRLKPMIRGSCLDVSLFSHVGKAIRDIWLVYIALRTTIYSAAFECVNLSMYITMQATSSLVRKLASCLFIFKMSERFVDVGSVDNLIVEQENKATLQKKKNTTRCKTFTNFFSNQEWT